MRQLLYFGYIYSGCSKIEWIHHNHIMSALFL